MRHKEWCDRVNTAKPCNCGLTGTGEAPKSKQKPLDVSDEKAVWDRVQENRAIAARED